jgi:hypothetical protein
LLFGKTSLMKRARILVGILALGLVLAVNLLAASPSLHEWVHADAGKEDHQCAVTLFAHGQVDSSAVQVAASLPAAAIEHSPQILASVVAELVETLPPGRGPPASLLHS